MKAPAGLARQGCIQRDQEGWRTTPLMSVEAPRKQDTPSAPEMLHWILETQEVGGVPERKVAPPRAPREEHTAYSGDELHLYVWLHCVPDIASENPAHASHPFPPDQGFSQIKGCTY